MPAGCQAPTETLASPRSAHASPCVAALLTTMFVHRYCDRHQVGWSHLAYASSASSSPSALPSSCEPGPTPWVVRVATFRPRSASSRSCPSCSRKLLVIFLSRPERCQPLRATHTTQLQA